MAYHFLFALLAYTAELNNDSNYKINKGGNNLYTYYKYSNLPINRKLSDELKLVEFDNIGKTDQDVEINEIESGPRNWLESQIKNCKSEGAYTVLRCENVVKNESSIKSNIPIIWGLEFHLNRLVSSYSELRYMKRNTNSFDAELCKKETIYLIWNMLSHAYLFVNDQSEIIMLTILWTPTVNVSNGPKIQVHAMVLKDPLASSVKKDKNCALILNNEKLVRRYDFVPNSKLNSWCIKRKVLENLNSKILDCDDFILSKNSNNQTELLEGLTSNLFVLYKNGNLRTASSDSVLIGYSRELILSVMNGSEIDNNGTSQLIPSRFKAVQSAPLLSEISEWDQMFLCNSINMVQPISYLRIFEIESEENIDKSVNVKEMNKWSSPLFSSGIGPASDVISYLLNEMKEGLIHCGS